MQIEHITLGGNSSFRDTKGIYPETVELLKEFEIVTGTKTLSFPKTDLQVKITSTEEGAIFDIMKKGRVGVTNICCFNAAQTNDLFKFVKQLHENTGFGNPRLPVLDAWIYSVIIDPLAFTPDEIAIAGEIELYIYYSLYRARK